MWFKLTNNCVVAQQSLSMAYFATPYSMLNQATIEFDK